MVGWQSCEGRDQHQPETTFEQHGKGPSLISFAPAPHACTQSVNDAALLAALAKKLAPPLVTLLGSEPEIQYVALRNINLIVQKHPNILAHEVKVSRGGGAVCNRSD